MTINKTVINDYGKQLTEMRNDFNDHVLNMLNTLDSDEQNDLTSFDIKVSFGGKQYDLGLTSSLSEEMTQLINSQIDEYGTDITPVTNDELLLTLTDYIMTTNSDLPLDTEVSDGISLKDLHELFKHLSK